jgi:hypothetical protein
MEALKKLFVDFLQNSSQENFLKMRSGMLADTQFDPYTDVADEIPSLMEAGEFEQALETMKNALFPQLLLSPGAHLNIAFILHKLGREKDASFEHYVSELLQKAIEESGDGTEASPYLVTRTSDEYDYFFAHDLEVESQALIKSPDETRSYDLLTAKNGHQVWFDVTDIMQILSRKMR